MKNLKDVSEITPPTLAKVSMELPRSDIESGFMGIGTRLNIVDFFRRVITKGRSDPSCERIAQSHDNGELGLVSNSSR